MISRRFAIVSIVAGLLLMGSPALPVVAFAQDLEFAQVGDQPIDANDLEFDGAESLWADAGELYRMLVGTAMWEEINPAAGIGDNLLVLSQDTIFLASDISVFRSTDGGTSFSNVYDEGGALFQAALPGPNNGLILTGTESGGTGISY